ncbi:remorin family protein [Actinidia rufa]|uniref:Remorin family protein n=1 Tax=Actinidia rufa TaxID=165716 RepID=A0A7J0G819_9ERIC|nr:remorin family protein [Actinidia rufa]
MARLVTHHHIANLPVWVWGLSVETMPCEFPSVSCHPLGSPSPIIPDLSSSAVIASILLYSDSLIMTVVQARNGFYSDNTFTELRHRDLPSLLIATASGEISYPSMEQIEQKKADYAEKMKNKDALVHKEAEEKRAIVEASRGEEILIAEEMAAKYRTTGYAPKKLLGCFGG